MTDYAQKIMEALPKGILLNTNAEKFNSMIIGWGHLGILWGRQTFHVYVRQGRYTKPQLDKTGEFTISIPLGEPDPAINSVCGLQSGYNIDKVKEAHLTLEEPSVNHTPGIKEYPLTLECKIIYTSDLDLAKMPEEIVEKLYPQSVPGKYPLANRDFHTVYVGEIVDAYIIR